VNCVHASFHQIPRRSLIGVGDIFYQIAHQMVILVGFGSIGHFSTHSDVRLHTILMFTMNRFSPKFGESGYLQFENTNKSNDFNLLSEYSLDLHQTLGRTDQPDIAFTITGICTNCTFVKRF
jgi:hypothetical protein